MEDIFGIIHVEKKRKNSSRNIHKHKNSTKISIAISWKRGQTMMSAESCIKLAQTWICSSVPGINVQRVCVNSSELIKPVIQGFISFHFLLISHSHTKRRLNGNLEKNTGESITCAVFIQCAYLFRKYVNKNAQKYCQILSQTAPTTVEGVKRNRVERRGWGNPYIHTSKSVSLSPPDKSPLEKMWSSRRRAQFQQWWGAGQR